MNRRTTNQIAKQLAHRLRQSDGGVVLLNGDLGAGKTTLVAAIVRELDPNAVPCSPSYTIINQYNDHIFHADLYRLRETKQTPAEFDQAVADVGLWDLVTADNYVFIEWAGDLNVPDAIKIDIKVKENGDREFIIA